MLAKPSKTIQLNLLHSPLSEMLDMSDSLIALSHTIDWNIFDDAFEKYYAIDGRPAKPIRLMVGMLLLCHGIYNNEADPIITNLRATASGGTKVNYGVLNINSAPVIRNSYIYGSNYGMYGAGKLYFSTVVGGGDGSAICNYCFDETHTELSLSCNNIER